jgi:hypothetical protein
MYMGNCFESSAQQPCSAAQKTYSDRGNPQSADRHSASGVVYTRGFGCFGGQKGHTTKGITLGHRKLQRQCWKGVVLTTVGAVQNSEG